MIRWLMHVAAVQFDIRAEGSGYVFDPLNYSTLRTAQ